MIVRSSDVQLSKHTQKEQRIRSPLHAKPCTLLEYKAPPLANHDSIQLCVIKVIPVLTAHLINALALFWFSIPDDRKQSGR
mmetsp:Transcript_50583/g.50951  ORF Transcript_50583/g.50951 Transcript_50583/m.50951 type:complete len:81 (-) Transcript_50583:526-768(-)